MKYVLDSKYKNLDFLEFYLDHVVSSRCKLISNGISRNVLLSVPPIMQGLFRFFASTLYSP